MEYIYCAIGAWFFVVGLYNAYKMGEYQKPSLEYAVIKEIPYKAETLSTTFIVTDLPDDKHYIDVFRVPKETYQRRCFDDARNQLAEASKSFIEISEKPQASMHDRRFQARLTLYRPKQ